MDDIVLLAIGRQFIEFAVRNEQLIRANQAANEELTKLKAPASPAEVPVKTPKK